MSGTFKRALIKIALAEHTSTCRMTFVPVDECTCYRPAEIASKALGIRPPWYRSGSEHARLLKGRIPNDELARPVDVAAIAEELPYRREEVQRAHDQLKLAIETAAHLASAHNMSLEHAAHIVGRVIEKQAQAPVIEIDSINPPSK